MYRRSIIEKIRSLEKKVKGGDKEVIRSLLISYRKTGKLKEYFQLLSTIRPLKKREKEEFEEATWEDFFQQARICEAQNKVDETLVQDILAFVNTNLERINLPKSGVICWNCDNSCADFNENKSNLMEIIRFIKTHKNCLPIKLENIKI